MSIRDRVAMYRALEQRRGRPLIVYVTSERPGADGQIGADAVREMHYQLEALPTDATSLDLLLVSNGGDPTVAWRVVTLIRERVRKLSVLVPQAAYSAATLIALGADEIVMHPNGNLGPTDPQITVRTKRAPDGPVEEIKFGSEDLGAFLRFAREEVGLSDQAHLMKVFAKFCQSVGAIPIGVAARSSQLSLSMGEKLLLLHMTSDAQRQKARAIAETLTKDFFHHGYPVSRTEAKNIGLPIAGSDPDTESTIWNIWLSLADELMVREPFLPMKLLKASPHCAPLFAPVPQAMIPANLPPAVAQQAIQQVLAQVQLQPVPPVPYETVHAVIESPRYASRFLIRGSLYATRLPDLQIKIAQTKEEQGWQTVAIPAGSPARAAKRKSAKGKKKKAT